MKKLLSVLVMFLMSATVLLAAGCGGKGAGKDSGNPPAGGSEPSSGNEASITWEGVSTFDFDLFKSVFSEDFSRNVFLSPQSARTALAMTYNGAEGATRSQMSEVLGFEGKTMDEVNQSLSQTQEALESADPEATLEIANSLWGKRGIDFLDDFIERNRRYYDARVSELDGLDPGPVNTWVEEKTRGRITNLIKRIDPMTVLLLVNAIYFKGEWKSEFDESLTEEEDFTALDGGSSRVPLMAQSGSYGYLETEQFQAVELPYGEGERISMVVFLPAEDVGLKRFCDSLDLEKWNDWMRRLESRQGDIKIPRFEVEYEKLLNDNLIQMGMTDAFSGDLADFSGMVPQGIVLGGRVFISQVLQKAYVKVDEKGTEAAASTAVEMMPTAVPNPEERFEMVVDRPFFFAIRDNHSQTLLFMGSIVEPSG